MPPAPAPSPAPPTNPRDAAVSIVRDLRARGFTAYLAGGCVRDELLGAVPEDYDVATDARPEDVRALFRRVSEVGAAFGVLLVRVTGVVVEVATFRREGAYSDRRRPDEVHFAGPEEDAGRRDFTINALFLDPLATPETPPANIAPVRGRVIDFVGGVADLTARLVRAVGDPDQRLREDDLRSLRAVRFAARLGFAIDPATADAVRAHAGQLPGVSRERIGDELRRMLAHPSRARAAALMDELGLSAPALGDEGPAPRSTPARTPALSGLSPGADFPIALAAWAIDRLPPPSPSGRGSGAAAITGAAPELCRRLRAALCLSNDERDDLSRVLLGVALLESDWSGLPVARQKRAAAAPWFAPAMEIVRARDADRADAIARRVEALSLKPPGLAPAPLITGDDLTAAGMTPGPAFGRWLEAAYDAQLEGALRTRAEALAFVQRLAAREPGR